MPAVFPTLEPIIGRPFVFTDPLFPGLRIYFGHYPFDCNGGLIGDPVGARDAFLAALANTAQSYGFEPLSTGALAPIAATFTGTSTPIVATIALEPAPGASVAPSARLVVMAAAESGRYNTTPSGSKYLRTAALILAANPPFDPDEIPLKWSITPNRAVAAFGFYSTDLGDFAANCLLDIRRPGGAVLEMMLPILQNSASGNLSFWGVIDASGGTFDKFTFGGTYVGVPSSSDYFGFDDFIVADSGQVIAEAPPPPAPAPAPASYTGTARPFISRDVKNAPGIQLQPLGREAPPPRVR